MNTRSKSLLALLIGLLTAWIAWGVYLTRSTPRVPYDRIDRGDGIERRRYPDNVIVETTAPDTGTAFWRLFNYLKGANESGTTVAMTAPVATSGETIAMTSPVRTLLEAGEEITMTAPVRTATDEAGVTMAFYLPADYTEDTAPVPTDERVRLAVEPERTLAVRSFSWYATQRRVDAQRRRLMEALADRDVELRGSPFLLQYNDPWTPPFMRRNEVAVEIG
jgi:hypothetical protein